LAVIGYDAAVADSVSFDLCGAGFSDAGITAGADTLSPSAVEELPFGSGVKILFALDDSFGDVGFEAESFFNGFLLEDVINNFLARFRVFHNSDGLVSNKIFKKYYAIKR
jgi:hypothetical protein